ncbi:hypothetical protein ACFP1Z_20555 [Streptomyces gamaensis]|uniref:SMI1/KNR4 family protein n=1 Tax=Streptomyces gamaensis TaxID=1763542 RepID=A0ABW0Z181_9ACTN
MESRLPAGWTIEHVRALSGDRGAVLLPLDRFVVAEDSGHRDYTPLQPETILGFHDLCLVLHDGEWFMGQIDDDGSVICWASYGADLGQAIRCL